METLNNRDAELIAEAIDLLCGYINGQDNVAVFDKIQVVRGLGRLKRRILTVTAANDNNI